MLRRVYLLSPTIGLSSHQALLPQVSNQKVCGDKTDILVISTHHTSRLEESSVEEKSHEPPKIPELAINNTIILH